VLAWKGAELFMKNIERNDFDVRAYYFPRWILTISFPVSFGLMAVEFARFVGGRDLMHSGDAGIHE
jgi:C4-dicarboxylate transporter DctQ subunit